MCDKAKKTDIIKQQEYDSGIILLLRSDDDIDACLAIMPPLLTRLPALRRGMKIYFNDLIMG